MRDFAWQVEHSCDRLAAQSDGTDVHPPSASHGFVLPPFRICPAFAKDAPVRNSGAAPKRLWMRTIIQ